MKQVSSGHHSTRCAFCKLRFESDMRLGFVESGEVEGLVVVEVERERESELNERLRYVSSFSWNEMVRLGSSVVNSWNLSKCNQWHWLTNLPRDVENDL